MSGNLVHSGPQYIPHCPKRIDKEIFIPLKVYITEQIQFRIEINCFYNIYSLQLVIEERLSNFSSLISHNYSINALQDWHYHDLPPDGIINHFLRPNDLVYCILKLPILFSFNLISLNSKKSKKIKNNRYFSNNSKKIYYENTFQAFLKYFNTRESLNRTNSIKNLKKEIIKNENNKKLSDDFNKVLNNIKLSIPLLTTPRRKNYYEEAICNTLNSFPPEYKKIIPILAQHLYDDMKYIQQIFKYYEKCDEPHENNKKSLKRKYNPEAASILSSLKSVKLI